MPADFAAQHPSVYKAVFGGGVPPPTRFSMHDLRELDSSYARRKQGGHDVRGRPVAPAHSTDANDQHRQPVSGMGAFANALMGGMKQMHESNMEMFNQVLGGMG